MRYDFVVIAESETPAAADPTFQHLVTTYVSEANKTASLWKAVPDQLLDFKPHERVNTFRTIFVHQLLSERRFFAQFVGLDEPPVDQLLPPGERPRVEDYLTRYVALTKARLPQLAQGTAEWWLTEMTFFGGLRRQRIWSFWRRVLHTCHHRTQVQTWLRFANVPVVPAIYGPSGDVRWAEDDPTYSLEAAGRGAVPPSTIEYFRGDATRPRGAGPRVLVHVCNDRGRWGKGFVEAVSKRWKAPEQRFRRWHAGEGAVPFALGRSTSSRSKTTCGSPT